MYDKVSCGPASGIIKPRYKAIMTMLGGDQFNPGKGVDVFIDLNTFINSLSTYSKYLRSLPFSQDAEADLVSTILLIVKHWKDFLKKWDGSRVFLFMNDFEIGAMPEQDQLKSYMVPYVNKFQAEKYSQLVYYVTEAVKRVEVVLKYVPGAYLIRCKRFDSYVVPNIVDDYSKNGRVRVVVSGSPMMTAYSCMKNTKVIYTRFIHTGMTQMVDPVSIVKSITKVDEDIMQTFLMNHVFYNILNAIVGDFDRGICGLTQVGISCFAVNLLRAVEKHEIPEDPKSIESVLPVIDEVYHDYLRKSYPLVDIDLHSQLIPKTMIEKMKTDMVDLYDIDGLKSLNVQGLNLLELL